MDDQVGDFCGLLGRGGSVGAGSHADHNLAGAGSGPISVGNGELEGASDVGRSGDASILRASEESGQVVEGESGPAESSDAEDDLVVLLVESGGRVRRAEEKGVVLDGGGEQQNCD